MDLVKHVVPTNPAHLCASHLGTGTPSLNIPNHMYELPSIEPTEAIE